MSQPAVTITELDGALGVLPPTMGRSLAIVGPTSQGPVDTPATFARAVDVQNTFGIGQAVEAACYYIERYGRSVLMVRTTASEAASVASVLDFAADGTSGATGTSTVTVTASPDPKDDYELVFLVVNGGTIGTAGITYKMSLDGGRNWSPVMALDTATTAAFPDSAGVSFDFAAGTLVAGEYYTALCTAAQWSDADMTSALTALKNTNAAWELLQVVGPVDDNAFDVIDPAVSGMAAVGKNRAWIGNTRIPATTETEAAYLTAMTAMSTAKSSKYGSVYSGGCKLTSAVSGRKYRRPVSFAVAAREAANSEEIDVADVNLGALPGVSIRDDNGNPDEHDESVNPGLDDLRYGVLRTVEGYSGVYVNRPRIFSPPTSDIQLMPHRRVMNLGHDALRAYFTKRLSKPVIVDKTTGYILESEAVEIELGALAALRSVLLAKPKASDAQVSLSRTDNLLSTKTMTGSARILPLAYPEFINFDLSYYNPVLLLQAA